MLVGGVRRAGGGVEVQEEGRSGVLPAEEETQEKGVVTESDIKQKSQDVDVEKAKDETVMADIPEELVEEEEEWPVYHLYNEIWPVSEEFP